MIIKFCLVFPKIFLLHKVVRDAKKVEKHCTRDSVAPLRRSSAGCMPARMGRWSAGVRRRHPVTVRKALFMAFFTFALK